MALWYAYLNGLICIPKWPYGMHKKTNLFIDRVLTGMGSPSFIAFSIIPSFTCYGKDTHNDAFFILALEMGGSLLGKFGIIDVMRYK